MATKKENFESVLTVLGDDYPELTEFIEGEIAHLARKRSVKPEVAEARAALNDMVLEVLVTVGEPMNTADVRKAFSEDDLEVYSAQKVSASLKALVAEGKAEAVEKNSSGITYVSVV